LGRLGSKFLIFSEIYIVQSERDGSTSRKEEEKEVQETTKSSRFVRVLTSVTRITKRLGKSKVMGTFEWLFIVH